MCNGDAKTATDRLPQGLRTKVRSPPPKGLINPIWCSFGPILLRKRSISTVLLAPKSADAGYSGTGRGRLRVCGRSESVRNRFSGRSSGEVPAHLLELRAPLLAGRRPPRVMAHAERPARAFPCRALGDLRTRPGATVETVRANRLHWCHRPVPERLELVQARLDRGHFAPFARFSCIRIARHPENPPFRLARAAK
jgi:hypothetical protein